MAGSPLEAPFPAEGDPACCEALLPVHAAFRNIEERYCQVSQVKPISGTIGHDAWDEKRPKISGSIDRTNAA